MTFSSAVLALSPRVWYRFGEASGTVAVDSSGNGRDATYSSGAAPGTTGLLVGDADTAVTIVNGQASLTHASWMDGPIAVFGILNPSTVSGLRTLVTIDNNGTGNDIAWRLRQNGSRLEAFYRGDPTGVGANGVLASGVTHTFAYTLNTTDEKLYLDGVLISSTTGPATVPVGLGSLRVGALISNAEPFLGVMDEVALFGSLSGADVTTLHNAAMNPATASTGTLTLGGSGGGSGTAGFLPAQTVFTSSGTFTPGSGVTSVKVLLVGGGGSGGTSFRGGGGGGAGGVVLQTNVAVTPGSPITVTVGAGGTAPVTVTTIGGQGGDSSFAAPGGTITALGGGGGGGNISGSPGGSGGGGAGSPTPGAGGDSGLGTVGQGHDGGVGRGSATATDRSGGGGGGAGTAGAAAALGYLAGAGGAGLDMSAHVGTSVGVSGWFGGGGGGGATDSPPGTLAPGGQGGGGAGDKPGSPAGHGIAGVANTGGGGGAGAQLGGGVDTAAGDGGSGVVVVAWVSAYIAAGSLTLGASAGTGTTSTSGSLTLGATGISGGMVTWYDDDFNGSSLNALWKKRGTITETVSGGQLSVPDLGSNDGLYIDLADLGMDWANMVQIEVELHVVSQGALSGPMEGPAMWTAAGNGYTAGWYGGPNSLGKFQIAGYSYGGYSQSVSMVPAYPAIQRLKYVKATNTWTAQVSTDGGSSYTSEANPVVSAHTPERVGIYNSQAAGAFVVTKFVARAEAPVAPIVVTGSGSLTLTATGGAGASRSGSGSLSLSGSASVAVTGTGSLTLGGSLSMGIENPRAVPGLLFWGSAKAMAYVGSGNPIPQWDDLSGSGNHATLSTAGTDAPKYYHNYGPGVGAGGATPGAALQFMAFSNMNTPSAKYLVLPTTLVSSLTQGEVFYVLRQTGGSIDSGLHHLNVSNGLETYYGAASGIVYEQFGSTVRRSFTPTIDMYTYWHRYNVWSAPNDWSAQQDGVTMASSATNTVAFDSNPRIGSDDDAFTRRYTGRMAMCLIFNRKLTTVERADVNTWILANLDGGVAPLGGSATLSLGGSAGGAVTSSGSGSLSLSGVLPILIVGSNTWASAALLTLNEVSAATPNAALTSEVGEPVAGAGKTAWWKIQPTADGVVRIDTSATAGPGDDTLLYVFTGSAVNALTPVDDDDDSGTGAFSQLDLIVHAGVTYYIQVDAYNSSEPAMNYVVTTTALTVITSPRVFGSQLKVWYSAQAILGLSDNAAISGWVDQSGSGNHAALSSFGTNAPKWRATGGPSGGPRVQFPATGLNDSTAKFLQLPNVLAGATSAEIFYYIKAGGATTEGGLHHFGPVAADACHYPYSSGQIYETFASTTRENGNPSSVGGIQNWARYNVSSSTPNKYIRFNEFAIGGNVGGNTFDNSITAPRIGSDFDVGYVRNFMGDMTTVLIFAPALTDPQRADVINWMKLNDSGGIEVLPATGSGSLTLSATGFTGAFLPATGSGSLTLSATGTADSIVLPPPVITFTITNPDQVSSPTDVTVLMLGGYPETNVRFYLDGASTPFYEAVTNVEGTLSYTAVPIPAIAAGTHTLGIEHGPGEFNPEVVVGEEEFTVASEPSVVVIPDVDTTPVEVPEAVVTPTRRWVLQDATPGGLGSYVLPRNPVTSEEPTFFRTLNALHTTSRSGKHHIFEASSEQYEWTFGGVLFYGVEADTLRSFFNLNRRFYLIDHFARAWVVTFESVEIVPRLRKPLAAPGLPVELTDYLADYTVKAVVYGSDYTVVS